MAKRDFLSLADWTAEELGQILERARELKGLNRAGTRPQTLQGRTLAMLFEKPSLRTHVTFEAGMTQLGGHAIWLAADRVGIGTRESARDVAQNLSRWVDALVVRTFSQALVEELAAEASIPVINGLTDLLHPCQVMADFQTIAERMELKDAVVAYVGDGNNMANSLVLGAAVLGMTLHVATPASHRPAPRVRRRAEELARTSGARIHFGEDPRGAVAGASFVYTDTWTSMGQEGEAAARREIFGPYRVDAALMEHAGAEAYFMHCLPAHRGEEVTDAVLDGERSLVLEQAENRLHAQKAILDRLLRAA